MGAPTQKLVCFWVGERQRGLDLEPLREPMTAPLGRSRAPESVRPARPHVAATSPPGLLHTGPGAHPDREVLPQ